MAYNLKKISPLDLKPSVALGVKIPFSNDNVFSSVYTTKEQTKYNLINFLLTDRGERVFNPTFGAGLRSYLFEQIEETTTSDLELMLTSQIENNFSNVKISTLKVFGEPQNNSITINFSYYLINSQEKDSVVINIQNN